MERDDRGESAPPVRRARVLPLVLEVALIVLPLAAATACGAEDAPPAPVDASIDTPYNLD